MLVVLEIGSTHDCETRVGRRGDAELMVGQREFTVVADALDEEAVCVALDAPNVLRV